MPRPKGWRKVKTMEIQEAKKEEPKVVQSQPETRAHLTAEEAALRAIIQKEDDSWLGLTDADIEDFSLSNDPYPLPKGCDKLLGDYAFRYCERDPKRVRELQSMPGPMRWWVCNATTCPALASHCDSITGAIHMRDQMLMIKPRWMMERVKALNTASDDAKFRAKDPDARRGERDGNFVWEAGDKARISDRDKVVYDQERWDGAQQEDSGEVGLEA